MATTPDKPKQKRSSDTDATDTDAPQESPKDSPWAKDKPTVTPSSRAASVTAESRVTAPTLQRPAPEDTMIGLTPLGQYKIVKKIGEGGFGAVYLAEQTSVDRLAVIKVLHKKLVESEVFVKRFEREAAVLARLDHHHLVRLYNFGEFDDGQLFLAMEYGGDHTVADEIKREGKLPLDRVLEIGAQICDALSEAHENGVVHRDLKPANILLSTRNGGDWAKLVDVGIAKILDNEDDGDASLTGVGMVIGTPAYFSPEQARGLSVDGRSDLYSMGVVLYEMLSGKLPIKGLTPIDYVRAHTTEAPAPLKQYGVSVPAAVETILARALTKDRAKRYQSAREMRDALLAVQTSMRPVAKASSRLPLILGGVAVAAVLAAIGGYFALRSPEIGKLQITIEPANADVTVDGHRLTAGLSRVAPGRHVLVARAPGYEVEVDEFELLAGQTLPVKIKLTETQPTAAAPGAPAVAEPAPEPTPAAPAAEVAPSPAVRHSTPAKKKVAAVPAAPLVAPVVQAPAPVAAAPAPKVLTPEEQMVAKCKPMLAGSALKGTVFYLGPDPGSSSSKKLSAPTMLCMALSNHPFGLRPVRLPDGTNGYMDDSTITPIAEQKH
jgi:serine/threonine protein kinase